MSHGSLEATLRRVLSPTHADGLDCSVTLYRYIANELSRGEAADFRTHLAHCRYCRADLEAFHRTSELEPRRRPLSIGFPWRAWALLGAAVLAGVVSLVLWGQRRDEHTPAPIAALHPKGKPDLHVAVRRGQHAFTAAKGTRFESGDVLAFFYTAPAETWPTVLFADSAGHVTRVFPQDAPVLMPSADQQPLAASAVVERATDCEWIVAFFSPAERRPDIGDLETILGRAVSSQQRDSTCSLNLIPPEGVSTSIVVLNGASE